MDIGEMIKNRRLELNLTLEEVGNHVGVSKSTVKKWEDGFISNMRRDKIAKLAKVLKINPVSFITGNIILQNENSNDYFHVSEHEKKVIVAYRQQHSAVRDAIDTMLHITPLAEEKYNYG